MDHQNLSPSDWPPIPEKLLLHLEKTYRLRRPTPSMSHTEIMENAGMVKLVEEIRGEYERQQDPDNG